MHAKRAYRQLRSRFFADPHQRAQPFTSNTTPKNKEASLFDDCQTAETKRLSRRHAYPSTSPFLEVSSSTEGREQASTETLPWRRRPSQAKLEATSPSHSASASCSGQPAWTPPPPQSAGHQTTQSGNSTPPRQSCFARAEIEDRRRGLASGIICKTVIYKPDGGGGTRLASNISPHACSNTHTLFSFLLLLTSTRPATSAGRNEISE
ncbi:hypothetical protein B0J12DRAFT_138063 [Macrophomina phaseolina]|uniref:Uncharacterized protein n=1 Tax=Macrophomina phaseolina TaxID=35725 RepID=A0ABQ8G9T9_9PEZI|nr:hypothetical protein B0J12DRAFT_138063 [Macrophomina phaseolina]